MDYLPLLSCPRRCCLSVTRNQTLAPCNVSVRWALTAQRVTVLKRRPIRWSACNHSAFSLSWQRWETAGQVDSAPPARMDPTQVSPLSGRGGGVPCSLKHAKATQLGHPPALAEPAVAPLKGTRPGLADSTSSCCCGALCCTAPSA